MSNIKIQQAMITKHKVFDCIMDSQPINQAMIAKKLGLSLPSVMKIVKAFDEKGLMRIVGKAPSRGGKPPRLLEIISEARCAIGVDIGRSEIKAVLADIGGNVITSLIIRTGDVNPPERLIEKIVGVIREVLEGVDINSRNFLGIGIGMPGLIDAKSGHVIFSPDFDWENVPLLENLKNRLPYPIHIENANMSMARGEFHFGAGKGSAYMLCVNSGYGIGGALITKGHIYNGSNGMSGEIGHITVMQDGGPLCTCGNYGCLEAVSSGDAIARQAKDLLRRNMRTLLTDMVGNDVDKVDAKMVFAAAYKGDIPCSTIVQRATEYIGTALATCLNILDLDCIVLNGGLTKGGDLFWQSVTKSFNQRRMRYVGKNVRLLQGKLGSKGTAVGATIKIMRDHILKPTA